METIQLIGTKEGMVSVFDQQGEQVACTVLRILPNVVTQIKTVPKDGYRALQLAAGQLQGKQAQNLAKPLRGHFAKHALSPRRYLVESRITATDRYAVGQEIGVEMFAKCRRVDVIAYSKGKGFQGVIKRHHFRGGPASHGASKFHRRIGSTGMRTAPGRVLPGKRMPGRMGGKCRTVECLEVFAIDTQAQCLLVAGGVPGWRNGRVLVRPAIKRREERS